MMESMATSSLVKMSTSREQEVPVSLSTEPYAIKTPSGRVTCIKTKAPPLPSDNAPTMYIDLEPKDFTALPVGKEPITIQTSSVVWPTKRTEDQPLGAQSIFLVAIGKTKLQFSIDR